MKNIATEIRALIIAEINGVISTEDHDRLEEIRTISPEVQALTDHLKKVLNAKKMPFDRPIEEEAMRLMRIGDERRKWRKKKRIRLFRYAAAFVLFIALFLCKNLFTSSFEYLEPPNAPASKFVLLWANDKWHELHGNRLETNSLGEITVDMNLDHQILITDVPEQPLFLKVPVGKTFNIKLSDNTMIIANSETKIWFPAKLKRKREIMMQGEINVKAIGDPDSPFEVVSDKTRIQVLGTEFNVNTYVPGQQKVAVISGRVKVTNSIENDIVLKQGEMVTINGNTSKVNAFDPEEQAWYTGQIVIGDADEAKIIQAFARYFDQKIVFDSPFSGKTVPLVLNRNESVKTLLQQIPGYTIEEKGDTIHLINKN